MGPADPIMTAPDTIHGDLGRGWSIPVILNLVHSPDNDESAVRKIVIWFPKLTD